MRGQISLELLFSFLIIMATIGTISLILLDFYEKVKKENEVIEQTLTVEQMARTIDTLGSVGNYKVIKVDKKYRIDNEFIILEYNGKSIIANTIFNWGTNAQHI